MIDFAFNGKMKTEMKVEKKFAFSCRLCAVAFLRTKFFLNIFFLCAVLLLCGCHKKNERMLQTEERYKDYPLHLLALANKPIDDNKNLDLSLINESVYGRTPLQLLAEYHYQYRRARKRKSIKVLKNFVEHGADINSLWDDDFRLKSDMIAVCIIDKANSYLQEFLRLSEREYVDFNFSGDKEGGRNMLWPLSTLKISMQFRFFFHTRKT